MLKNQIDNQIDNQVEKNVSCSIFLEQINLINQLPIEERGNVLYMAILNSFRNCIKNQIDNQIENTYISISTSISLSLLSKSVLELMNKTLNCRIYSSNYGGKRKGAGRPKKEPIIDGQSLYGEYNNVCLSKKHYDKLLGICLSEKLLNELINSFSVNIEVGKERPYIAELPNAHYERLKAYYNFRVKNPEKFHEQQAKSNKAFDEFYEKEKARLAAKGIY